MSTTSTTNPGEAFDRALARERGILAEADRRRAVLAAGRAAARVAAVLPEARMLIFRYVEDDSWLGATLEAVRGPGGALLWFGDLLADTAEAAQLVYSGGPTVAYFDQRTNRALDEALTSPQDVSWPHFRACTITGADPGSNPGDDEAPRLVALDAPAAVQAAEQVLAAAAVTRLDPAPPDDGDPIGGLAAHLTADEIECALRTLVDLWSGADHQEGLSRPQQAIAGRVAQLCRAQDGE